MTPAEFKAARQRLGLSARVLAERLGVEGFSPDRTIRYWETEGNKVPGPVAVAVQYMLQEHDKRLSRGPSDD